MQNSFTKSWVFSGGTDGQFKARLDKILTFRDPETLYYINYIKHYTECVMDLE